MIQRILDWLIGPPSPPPLYVGEPASPKFPGCWTPRSRPEGDVVEWMLVLRSIAEREARARRRRQRWRKVRRWLGGGR